MGFCVEVMLKGVVRQSHNPTLSTLLTYGSLEAITLRNMEEADPRFRFCPATHCNAGQIHQDTKSSLMVCNACGLKSCVKHGMAWHEDMTCEAYDDSHPNDLESKSSMRKIRTMAKKCPGAGCGFYIEKDGAVIICFVAIARHHGRGVT